MPGLNDLQNVTLNGNLVGAYDPLFRVAGLDQPVSLSELLIYILSNLGPAGGDTFVTEASLDGDTLTITRNDASTVQVDLSALSTDNDDFVADAALQGNNLVLTLDSGGTVSVDLSALSGGGGGGLLQYQATGVNGAVDNGCFVTATLAGATYERTGGAGQNTEGILTVPAGGILQGVAVHFSAGQAPGNTFYLNVDYDETGKAVNGSENTVMPVLGTVMTKPAGFTDGSPATNFVHAGTPLQIGIAQVDDNGSRVRVRYKFTN
ncbi:MAG: hypothetical protein KDC54_12515, partial [Lewinella sp.]|nr:hypothetical protein [Lewinella sp.]